MIQWLYYLERRFIMRRKYSFNNFMDMLPLIIAILIVTVVWVYMDLEYSWLFHMIACVTIGFIVSVFIGW
nr:MAG TPA: hypothetical protein [Caudoviricetes sp.]